MEQRIWGCTSQRWLRGVSAVAVALTLSLGQANAFVENAHEGGQGQDKERRGAGLDLSAFGDAQSRDAAEGSPAGTAEPQKLEASAGPAETPEATVDADAAVTQEASLAEPRTRTVTRTRTSQGIIKSVTRSVTFTLDEDGRNVIAKSVARARVPDDVAAVENGAGRIVAKTSVDVTGAGTASADAGGTIDISHGKVEVSTFGKTSAEVH